MTVSNIGVASVLSDPFGVTATRIISYLLNSDEFDEKKCRSLIKGQAKAKSDKIIDSIKGFQIEPDQRLKLEIARVHLDYLEKAICKTEVGLYVRIRPYWRFVEYIAAMPGMTKLSATIPLAEINADMTVFEDAKQLTSGAGLAPACNESAGKKKSSRISKAGQYLKPMLVQYALAAVKSKKEPCFAIKYFKIKKRRGHKKAIIAIVSKMLVCIFHMIAEDSSFEPNDYDELRNPKSTEPKDVLFSSFLFTLTLV